MSPADGSDLPRRAPEPAIALPVQAILLHGGQALLLFEGLEARPPAEGSLAIGTLTQRWTSECWRIEHGEIAEWCGLAVLDALPSAGALLTDANSTREWRLQPSPRIDITPQPLADLVRRGGGDSRAIFGFLSRHLLAGRQGDSPEAHAHQAFAAGFFTASAERDGFIEILATPESGGLFAQGWSMSLPAGKTTLASVAQDLAIREVEVAVFQRDDILPPAQGFCLHGKVWRDNALDTIDAVFFERNGRLLRLDVVHGSVLTLEGTGATQHVLQMLPRLDAPEETRRAFKRVCRPVYHGLNTLAGCLAPIAAACDAVLRAPNGNLLLMGWMLDPQRRVERVLVKSSANLYAQINANWCALPRADLNVAFEADPRFTGLMDDGDVLHGFIAQVPARLAQTEGAQVYLEITLDDDSCLFLPISVTPFESAERLPRLLAALAPDEPQLDRIVSDHLTPFLTSVRPTARSTRNGSIRPIVLGKDASPRTTAAIIPFRSYAELQPIFALLAGTPEADAIDLILVASRTIATQALPKLRDAFLFYDLAGSLVFTPETETCAGRLDAGLAATRATRILRWMPSALPMAKGWLAQLQAEAAALPGSGLLSPALIYEDGSIYFSGDRPDPFAPHGACARSGYSANWMSRGDPLDVASGAPEIALIDRAALDKAGGFSGHLFSDALAHVDLSARLRRAGLASHCSGSVEFWMLDDPRPNQESPFARLMQKVDAAMLRRVHSQTGDRTE